MHVVVHVGELQRVRERVDATRDKPYRQSTATRSARQPDPDTMLSSERVERGAHIIVGREKTCPFVSTDTMDSTESAVSFIPYRPLYIILNRVGHPRVT